MSKLKVSSLYLTMIACPAQWEGTLSDGRVIRIRSRHARLSISVDATANTAAELFDFYAPDEWNGADSDLLCDLATNPQVSEVLDFSDVIRPSPLRSPLAEPTKREAEKISDILKELTVRLATGDVVDHRPSERLLLEQCKVGRHLLRTSQSEWKNWCEYMLSVCSTSFEDINPERLVLMMCVMSEEELRALNPCRSAEPSV